MPRSQNVPGPENRGAQSGRPDKRLSLRTHGNIGLHHRCWMRNADVYEMPDLGELGSLDGGANRLEVDGLEFGGLGRAGVRHSHQVHERASLRNALAIARAIER